jgi:hypothetical protein
MHAVSRIGMHVVQMSLQRSKHAVLMWLECMVVHIAMMQVNLLPFDLCKHALNSTNVQGYDQMFLTVIGPPHG